MTGRKGVQRFLKTALYQVRRIFPPWNNKGQADQSSLLIPFHTPNSLRNLRLFGSDVNFRKFALRRVQLARLLHYQATLFLFRATHALRQCH